MLTTNTEFRSETYKFKTQSGIICIAFYTSKEFDLITFS